MNVKGLPTLDQVIARLEQKPLEVDLWEKLTQCVKAQKDTLSAKSLEVILAGVSELQRVTDEAKAKKEPPPKLSSFAQGIFIRLAKSYNNPKLLKDIGTIYLNELRLPAMALLHFQRAQNLGSTEKELPYLIEAASLCAQQQATQKKGPTSADAGVRQAQHARPVVADVIRRTAKILLPSTLHPPPKPNLAAREEAPRRDAEATLPATTAECLAEARKDLERHNFNRAHTLLLKANENPENDEDMWRLWTDLGMAHYEAGSYKGMEAAYEEARKYGREVLASYFNLALAQHLNQKFEQAAASYLMADQIEADNPKVLCNLGVIYFQTSQYARAEAALRRAVEAKPDYARAWDNLASVLGAENRLEESLDACQHVIALQPHNPDAHFKIGVIYFGTGRQAEAAESFAHASESPVLRPLIYAFIGIIHAHLNQLESAEASIKQAASADPHCGLLVTAWSELGMALSHAGEHDRAIAAYEKVTKIKPDDPEAWFNLGVCCYTAGDRIRAQHCYLEAIDLNEYYHNAWHNLGVVCAELGLSSEASTAFRCELRENPNQTAPPDGLSAGLNVEVPQAKTPKRGDMEPAMNAWLETNDGHKIPLQGACTIGRSSHCQFVLPDTCISRRHTLIQQQNEHEYWLVDLGSSNGTKLNGRRLTHPCRLEPGDLIRIHTFEFRFSEVTRTGKLAPTLTVGMDAEVTQRLKALSIERIHCWLLLADIEGSTKLSQLAPADEWAQTVGGWLLNCRDDIEAFGGTVNKYLGDGIFAYLLEGAEAALRIRQLLMKLAAHQVERKPPFRITLHYGSITTGGVSASGEESLLGAEVNFVFRLEKLAGQLQEPILLSANARTLWPVPEELVSLGEHVIPSFDGSHEVFGLAKVG